MFSHVTDRMTRMESVRDAMFLLTRVIETIELPAFDLDSPVHTHHDNLEWSQQATEMKTILDDMASKLFVRTKKDMKDQIKKEMSFNDK